MELYFLFRELILIEQTVGGIYMNEKFIIEVLQRAMMYINNTQCKKLDQDLRIVLQKYEDLKERSTEIMDIDKSYMNYLQLFLIRKKTEGKSDRTLDQYKLHLVKLLQYLNKPLNKITEDDLFLYLATYKKSGMYQIHI